MSSPKMITPSRDIVRPLPRQQRIAGTRSAATMGHHGEVDGRTPRRVSGSV